MKRFNEFVSQAPPVLPVLPVFHTCDGFDFAKILVDSKLDVSLCPTFKKPLLYFFYGKPAYRPSKDDLATKAPAFMPIAIALRPDSLRKLEQVAPFDTGAYAKGLYSSFMHHEMKCEDFLLNPDLQMPGRVVSRFFGSNLKYYFGLPTAIDIPPLQFEATSYQDLIHDASKGKSDDRRTSIELQCGGSLVLDSSSVLFVVLPNVFLDDSKLLATLLEWGAEFKGYQIHRASPREFVSKIYDLVECFLRDNGYLS